ncbi:hypothetical protein JOF56_003912 [Kibdelosporangium banguiense]|uniref:Uncharacterized protein n=1 Tax=Kibdelosporangium banguiense TaxID=1365924 RepID=A0ABS4TGH3_9PSEU|nr:hypothetical protein [Kibdelosporangium banguiense]
MCDALWQVVVTGILRHRAILPTAGRRVKVWNAESKPQDDGQVVAAEAVTTYRAISFAISQRLLFR